MHGVLLYWTLTPGDIGLGHNCAIIKQRPEDMTRLEQIVEQTRSLSQGDKRKLRQILDLELEQAQRQEHAQPTSGDSDAENTRRERLEWLKAHREQYAGQYVALAGSVLVGHGRTIREAHEQARRNGVEKPFLVRMTSESEVLFAGW
jgi:hypothetical protein